MYLELIAHAEDTLRKNRRVYARSCELRAQTNSLMFTYRAHRFPHLSGGADRSPHADLVATIRSKIRAGALPAPTEARGKCWAGKGTTRTCRGCDVPILSDAIEFEFDLASGGSLLFDAACLAAWNEIRGEPLSA